MAARSQVHPRCQPGEGIGDEVGDRQSCETERLSGQTVRAGRPGGRHDRRDPWVGGSGQDRPDGTHRVAGDGPDGHLGLFNERPEGGQRVGAELTCCEGQVLRRVLPVASDIEGQAMEARRMEERRDRQRSVPGRFPAVDEHDARTGCAAARRDEPCRQREAGGLDEHGFVWQADVSGRDHRRVAFRVAGADAVGQREAVGETEGRERGGSGDACATEVTHPRRGRHQAGTCQVSHVATVRCRATALRALGPTLRGDGQTRSA